MNRSTSANIARQARSTAAARTRAAKQREAEQDARCDHAPEKRTVTMDSPLATLEECECGAVRKVAGPGARGWGE